MAPKSPRKLTKKDFDEYDLPEPTSGIGGFFRDVGVRETIESILVAVMLALLFKAFEAEAFVIPTGSMAPTLMGQHKDLICEDCGFEYQANASMESPDRNLGTVVGTMCPLCRVMQPIDIDARPNDSTFSGDRLLVSKFAYDIAEPRRWDVIVFRYPNNAKQNYIKRLVALPGEWLLIENGDLFTWFPPQDDPEAEPPSRDAYTIARKDPRKLLAMLQVVDDNHFVAKDLQAAGWPLRWQDWQAAENSPWQAGYQETQAQYSLAPQDETTWLSYRHVTPRPSEWNDIRLGNLPERIRSGFTGELITDFYAYNQSAPSLSVFDSMQQHGETYRWQGDNWVGDLVLEAEMKVETETGTLTLQLVEGGVRFTCTIDVATGQATLAADSKLVQFDQSESNQGPTATTRLQGAGSYRIRFGNVDDQLYLWINDQPIDFPTPTTFTRQGDVMPQWSSVDPGDAQPLAIGASQLGLQVNQLRVLRDIYYISDVPWGKRDLPDYRLWSGESIQLNWEILSTPELWNTPSAHAMFRSRQRDFKGHAYQLKTDQFFALGDNSPQSLDARGWENHHYVERENLIGKALFLYWPHTWWSPIPLLPNFKRMGFIR